MVGAKDLTHFDRKGGHIGLMAGSKARSQTWPDISTWLAHRSGAPELATRESPAS